MRMNREKAVYIMSSSTLERLSKLQIGERCDVFPVKTQYVGSTLYCT